MLHPAPYIRPGGPSPVHMQMGPSPGPIRPQYNHQTPTSHPYNPQPIRIMQPNQRAPMPPLYRVPVSLSQQMQPQQQQRPQHRPLFQMTSTPQLQKQSIFMKSRLQKAVNGEGNGNFPNSPPQVVLSSQTAIRPRFLSPPAPGPNQFHSVTVPVANVALKEDTSNNNTPSPKLPKVQSVHSGVTIEDFHLEPLDAEQTARNSPKRTSEDMASVLVQRGITITRNKPSTNGVTVKSEPGHDAIDDSLLACPVSTCKEKFVTENGLQKHVEIVHKKDHPVKVIMRPTHDKPQTISIKNGLILKTFKCTSCTAHFTTQQGLVQHQNTHHKEEIPRNASPQSPMLKASLIKGNNVPNEIGIPLVDLSNELTRRKLTSLGIYNFIPVANRDLAPGGFFGFPVVSLQGSSNPAICNLGELGASSILSLGPVRQIPK